MTRISSELRKNLRNYIADLLHDIADLERTKQEWAGLVPDVARSFSEDAAMFFDDWLAGRDLDWNVSRGLLEPDEAADLKAFYSEFSDFASIVRREGLGDSEIVEDARWHRVSKTAAETYLKVSGRLRD